MVAQQMQGTLHSMEPSHVASIIFQLYICGYVHLIQLKIKVVAAAEGSELSCCVLLPGQSEYMAISPLLG